MTPDEIARLRELNKARTQGTYRFDPDEETIWTEVDASLTDEPTPIALTVAHIPEDMHPTADYIVAACNALPGLLEELERLQKIVDGGRLPDFAWSEDPN